MNAPVSPNLLFVDDDQNHRTVMAMFFEAIGWQISTAKDALEGLDQMASGSYDVVVTDMRMPDVDGLEMVRRWRRMTDPDRSPPILLVSSLVTDEMRHEAEALGIHECHQRPLRLEAFAKHIEETVLS